jgi:hypothetical protein
MGLFRSRARKKREKAAAELIKTQVEVAKPEVEVARPEVEVAQPEVIARREVTAKARVDPDQPGWGRAIGQEIAKARGERSGQL